MVDGIESNSRPYSRPEIKSRPGRPWRAFSTQELGELKALASVGATDEEIAAHFGCERKTIIARRKDCPAFADAYRAGWKDLRISLRRTQIRAAIKGSGAMLVWLGKNILGQMEQPPPSTTDDEQTDLLLGIDDDDGFRPLIVRASASISDVRKTTGLPDVADSKS